MNDEVYARYVELQQYVGYSDADARRMAELSVPIGQFLPSLVDEFYAEIARHAATRQVITGGDAQIQRLKHSLLSWLQELFSGCYDADYVARRWRVGLKHVEIGLDQAYTNAALSRVRQGLNSALERCLADDVPRLLAALRSLSLQIDLDLAIIESAYQSEHALRLQQRALQAERLAAIGQTVTGLAHESRNALQRSQACLEMLVLEVNDRPQALNLVARLQQAQDDLHELYEEVRDYAAPIVLRCSRHSLVDILHDTWADLAVSRAARDARLTVEAGSLDTTCNVDRRAVEQVFRNIIENSLAACRDPVEIAAKLRETSLEGRPAVQVALIDNGPGLSPEAQQKIFEPFYTTKVRGTGLGMAICRRLVEAHGGTIAVGEKGAGAAIVVTLLRNPL
ncbi:MAG: protoglobin domain-containing protein [Planctomycetaceae bacterium]